MRSRFALLAAMLVSLWHVLPQMAILLIVCFLTGWHPDMGTLYGGVLSLAILMILGTALSLIFSVANVFWRDFGSLVSIMTNFVRFGCTMIYGYDQLEAHAGGLKWLVLDNPIAVSCLLFQRAFWVGTTDDRAFTVAQQMPDHLLGRGVIMIGVSAVILGFAQLCFSRLDNKIPEML